jgi:hypothetical protein
VHKAAGTDQEFRITAFSLELALDDDDRQECLNVYLVLVARRREGQDRRVADLLQRESFTLRARLVHTREFARRCGLQAALAIPEEPEVPTSERY